MDNLTIFDTCVHEKRILTHNLNYLQNVVTHSTHSSSSVSNTGIHIYLSGNFSYEDIKCESVVVIRRDV